MSTRLEQLSNEASCVAAVAGYGIPGSMADLPAVPLSNSGWADLVAEVQRHRLAALLAAAVNDAALPVEEQQARDVQRMRAKAGRSILKIRDALADAVDVLEQGGVEARVLDGAAVAQLDYHRAPGLRTFSTLELLVRREQMGRASALLATHGCTPVPSPPGPAEVVWLKTAAGLPLSVQCRLPGQPDGVRVEEPRLWERYEAFGLDGRSFRALGRAERLLDACCRAAGSSGGWGQLRDVAEAVLHPDLDAQEVIALAAEWQVEQVVAEAVSLAWLDLQLADIVALSTWARTLRRTSLVEDSRVARFPGTKPRQEVLTRLAQRMSLIRARPSSRPRSG